MCDYSLHSIQNRLAAEGERLVVHRFQTGSLGMAAEADLTPPAPFAAGFWKSTLGIGSPARKPECAVCIPPGARLLLRDIPEALQREAGVGAEEEVTFTQLSADANVYRDAVRFRNGVEVLLQRLRPGQRVDVLSVWGTPEDASRPAAGSAAERPAWR